MKQMYKSKFELNHPIFKTILILFTFSLMVCSVYAQKTSSISGTVVKKSTQQSLPGAIILIEGTNLGSAADANGRFRILNIPVKTYNLVVSSIGF